MTHERPHAGITDHALDQAARRWHLAPEHVEPAIRHVLRFGELQTDHARNRLIITHYRPGGYNRAVIITDGCVVTAILKRTGAARARHKARARQRKEAAHDPR